jgi:ATP-dependent protease ClpP protease subunit
VPPSIFITNLFIRYYQTAKQYLKISALRRGFRFDRCEWIGAVKKQLIALAMRRRRAGEAQQADGGISATDIATNLRVVAALVAAIFFQSGNARAADIFMGGMNWTGIPAIFIKGRIELGDDLKFAAVAATRQTNYVYLDSNGGSVVAAIAIGRQVRRLGLDTVLGRGGTGCSSACPMILLSGRHVIVQRNALLWLHSADIPQGTAMAIDYYRELGLTPAQIAYIVSTPYPAARMARQAEVAALGFQWQTVPSLFGGWRSCTAKYCLATP